MFFRFVSVSTVITKMIIITIVVVVSLIDLLIPARIWIGEKICFGTMRTVEDTAMNLTVTPEMTIEEIGELRKMKTEMEDGDWTIAEGNVLRILEGIGLRTPDVGIMTWDIRGREILGNGKGSTSITIGEGTTEDGDMMIMILEILIGGILIMMIMGGGNFSI